MRDVFWLSIHHLYAYIAKVYIYCLLVCSFSNASIDCIPDGIVVETEIYIEQHLKNYHNFNYASIITNMSFYFEKVYLKYKSNSVKERHLNAQLDCTKSFFLCTFIKYIINLGLTIESIQTSLSLLFLRIKEHIIYCILS
jgi:hypothetical protein